MVRRSISIFAILLYGLLTVPGKARAETTLNRAVVEETRNQVQLLLQNQSSRLAQVSDVLVPGDGLSTANDALAELRFNDGSLGRLGEQVVFWFTPGTRNFSLSNGTVLLLIPPGQGRTTIQTPNASAGIQGSALFVRYIEETDTTVVGALTDSDIQVTNTDGSQQYTLAGGEMAVAVGDRITDIFEFDLQTFYETSTLARDLAPPDGSDRETTETEVGVEQSSADSSSLDASEVVDPAIAAVQAEMRTALQRQQPISAENSVETPDFLRMPTESSDP
ncbi:MAG: FecR domain-containing protein, partial [Synechococcales cyanobacterium T60_A2020_003]|nr:FecR domain-containing protein [Synechococcales cyanobacterium T60_A2020_003]